ncbi:MAG: hypothetical protein U0Q12_10500 [Vicinamibacterales bacterium]
MKRSHLIALVVVLALVAFWWSRRGADRLPAIDLVEMFAQLPETSRRTNVTDKATAINTGTLAIGGDEKPILFMHPTSRVTYVVTVPYDGWFRAFLAIRPEAWEQPGDGVLFRMGVSDGRTYDELINVHVDPANNPSDKRWVEVSADLSAYAGQTVEVVLNTNSSLPGRGDDTRNDWAVWGSPQILVQR